MSTITIALGLPSFAFFGKSPGMEMLSPTLVDAWRIGYLNYCQPVCIAISLPHIRESAGRDHGRGEIDNRPDVVTTL